MTVPKGKIGVLIEEHFDGTEFRRFNEYFPEQGYEVEYISHLWGNSELTFGSNPENAYAMDRLRYQVNVKKGQKNQAPAVEFLRQAVQEPNVKLGTICHSLWLFCADPDLLKGKKVTCAHNIICDVENAGAEIVYDGDVTADLVIDGNFITGKHPGMVDQFMETFVSEIEAA
jgi:putative intracellular protease/amidase